ncbi:bifunctional riboflavin kinase/FAD synthetase [Campylobacter hyointestinalis]|uniref:bifunctional riboflavin kinase/FAD synthetase n=1 Tax=Campylobacter hyointestinalis TaxID=198 RepID=UPI0015EF80F9|nr:bifunctional riboflavin kinase/FAD synthetase [Campylobacter hyointestinalis]
MLNHSTTIEKNDIDSIAIGHFDGIHKGHKELIKELGKGGALVVIESNKACITPGDRREEYSGVPCFYYYLKDIENLRGDEFLKLLEADFPNLKRIIVGYDFKFGKDRAWDKHDLKNLFHGEVIVVKEFCFDGLGVHSSAIRRFLRDGDIYRANRLLGREYSIKGRVVSGQGIGKKSVYPTLNLKVEPYLLPKDGVYATRTKIDNATYSSITFIGNRLSTDGAFSIENHLLDINLHEKVTEVKVCFIERIRDNIKFSSLLELKEQISKDILIARNVAKACDLSLQDNFIHSRDLV